MRRSGAPTGWEGLLDWRAVVGALAFLGLGWLAGDLSMQQTDLRMREELLQQAIQVAAMIDSEAAGALSFTSEDKGAPAFEGIREKMVSSARRLKQRSIYSMALRDAGIVFGPESLDEDDPMASAPGEVYEQPSAGDWEVLRSGKPFVAGPVTDEYGTFITAVAPVFDPDQGEVVMAVGMDVVADEWQAQIRAARIPSIAVAALVALVLLGGTALIRWRRGMPKRGGRFAQLEGALVAVLGLIATAGLFWQAERLETERMGDRFRMETAERAGLLRAEICRYLTSVDSIRRFFEGSDFVDGHEFQTFVQPVTRDAGYRAVEWAPRVAAGDRGESYPVLHVEPRRANASEIGRDLGSDLSLGPALARARDTTRPATHVGRSPSDDAGQDGADLLLIMPAYRGGKPGATVEQRRASLAGFIVATIDIRDGVRRILRGAAPRGISHRLFDLSSEDSGRALFDDGALQPGTAPVDARFIHTLDFPFADRIFRIASAPTPEFFAGPTKRARLWIILPLGVIIALVSAAYTHKIVASRSRAEVERLEIESRLLHAQKLESLGVLAGGIAHDFSNLLAAIQGNLDLAVADLPPKSPATPSIDQAMNAARRATDLTRQLLAYAGKGQAVVTPVNVGELVTENVHLLRAAIPKTVALDLHIDESVPPVLADPGQIQQVVMNLITNAAEAIENKPGTVAISTGVLACDAAYLARSCIGKKPAPGRFARIIVTDTGCGMDEETRQKLFEPFFTTKLRGRGLGMSAVLGIIQAHHGAILIRTRIDRGTAIEVLLPVSTEAEIARNDDLAQEIGGGPGFLVGGASDAILVVDDESPIRDLCARMVERCGFRAIHASTGQQAIDIFRKHEPEIACVILDMVMPQMDGVSTFRALRTIRPDVRVIRCSGFDEEDTAHHFEGIAFTRFLQKPFHFSTLKAELAAMLAEPRHAPDPTRARTP